MKRMPSMLLAGTLLLAACAGPNSSSDAPAAGSGAPTPTQAAPAPTGAAITAEAAAAPSAAKALIGQTYQRAYILPATLGDGWKQTIHADSDKQANRDFMLLDHEGLRYLAVAMRGKHLHGRSYEYTVTDELALPADTANMAAARCRPTPKGRHAVLAVFAPDAKQPAWAARLDKDGKPQPLTADELAHLRCDEKPKP